MEEKNGNNERSYSKWRSKGKSVLENLATALVCGDILAVGKLIKDFWGSPYFIREALFWHNFTTYLENSFADEEELRKLSAKLAEGGNAEEAAKRVIKIIDDVGTRQKAIYISNLTRAFCMDRIDVNLFFKLSQCVVRLTDEDLKFLCESVVPGTITEDKEYIDNFRSCGLMKEVSGGFVYTERAYKLKEFALWYGHDVQIPEIPERQIMEPMSKEEIDKMFEGTVAIKDFWNK